MIQTGAQILIRALMDMGVETVFGYPGGAVLHIYDALYEHQQGIRHIITSHEQGAAHAADGYARSTGKTGVVIATSGPGATNLVTGLATAYHDSVPLIAITGNVTKDLIGRDSFQEVDVVNVTNPVVKYNYFVQDVKDLAATVREAFTIANSGRKGPVLIDIPKDVTIAKAEYKKVPMFEKRPFPGPDAADIERVVAAIAASKKPLIYCGGGVTFSDGSKQLIEFAERINAPVCLSMMGLSSLPPDHSLYLGLVGMHGTPAANMAVSKCDLLITVGARFSDRVAGNRIGFAKNAVKIHIDIDRSELSKNVAIDMSLVGDAGECLAELTKRLPEMKNSDWLLTVLKHKAPSRLPSEDANGMTEEIRPQEVLRVLHEIIGKNAIVATDVGQHQMQVAQHYPFYTPRTFISSCGLGTMGYGMGAANGAAMGNPDRRVVLVTGDGSFHMNMNELAVSVSNKLPIIVLIMNNEVLGMVHQWQNLFHGGRYSQTELSRATDYVKLAEAFGAKGLRITDASQIREVISEAAAHDGPCVIDCKIPYHARVFPFIPPGGTEKDMIFEENREVQGNATKYTFTGRA